jgi:hypothetical protein
MLLAISSPVDCSRFIASGLLFFISNCR